MENETPYISKTQKKKEAHDLQKLGETLAGLPVSQIRGMTLPEKLRQALIEGKSITAKVAARRHRQYLGVLMREADPEAIRLELEFLDDAPPEPQAPSETQVWMDRLLTEAPEEVEAFISTLPVQMHQQLRQQVRQLLRNIKKEQAGGKPSKTLKTLEEVIQEHLSLREG